MQSHCNSSFKPQTTPSPAWLPTPGWNIWSVFLQVSSRPFLKFGTSVDSCPFGTKQQAHICNVAANVDECSKCKISVHSASKLVQTCLSNSMFLQISGGPLSNYIACNQSRFQTRQPSNQGEAKHQDGTFPACFNLATQKCPRCPHYLRSTLLSSSLKTDRLKSKAQKELFPASWPFIGLRHC